MDLFTQQIMSVLTVGPGSLAYHLVISFSIVAALTATLYGWRKDLIHEYRRLAFGLGLLIFLRLSLFTAAGLAWQGVVSTAAILPWLERIVDSLSLLLMVWLWAFPKPTRTADIATICLALVLVGLAAWGISSLAAVISNLDWLILPSIAILGVILLAVRRPPAWIAGLFSVGLIGASSLAAYFLIPAGDQNGALRLAQMVAYPFLIVLPLRLSTSPFIYIEGDPSGQASSIDPGSDFVLNLVNKLALLDSPAEVGKTFSVEIAQWMEADISLIALPSDQNGITKLPFGYDTAHRMNLGDLSVSSRELPVLERAFSQGRHLCLPGNSTAPDLKTLAKTLDLKRSGSVLAVSHNPNQIPTFQLILLTPYSARKWTPTDLGRVLQVFHPLAHILQHSLQSESIELERQRLQQDYENAQARLQKSESDRARLMDMVAILQPKSWSDYPASTTPSPRNKGQDLKSGVSQTGSGRATGRTGSLPESGRPNAGADQKTARSASLAEDGKRE